VTAQGDPTAVVGRRTIAWVIDALVITIPVSALAASNMEYLTKADLAADGTEFDTFCDRLSAQSSSSACVTAGDRVYFQQEVSPGSGLLGFALVVLIWVVLQGLTGMTIGKALVGLRTVAEDGQRPGIGRASIRTILWAVDALPYCLPLVGFITGLTTTGHRRVGDMAAKTFVVRAHDAGAPIMVPGMAPAGTLASPYGVPMSPEPTAVVSEPEATGVVSAPEPQWDEARQAWITWDEARGEWLEWNDARSSWGPISQ
jgi:hypothetical protein